MLCTPHFRVYCFLCPLRAQMENAMRFPLLCSRSAPKGGSTRNACGCFSKKQPNPPLSHTKKHIFRCAFLLCVNTYFDTICVHPLKSAYTLSKFAYSLLKMRTVKCTDKLKFMVAKQILDWGTQILLSTRLPEIQIFCTAPLVQSLFHHFHEMLIP